VISNLIGEAGTQVGVPVLVALITTLVVEYFAKPSLEARTARLIRDRQQMDEVIFAFQKAALEAGALMTDEQAAKDALTLSVRNQQLAEVGESLGDISDAIARLPSRYVEKHARHIGVTAYFVSYARGFALAQLNSPEPSTDYLRELGAGLSKLDVYFLAYVEMRDSQEPWIKRFATKSLMRGDLQKQEEQLFEKFGLHLPDAETTP
jgi:hypothetical protein